MTLHRFALFALTLFLVPVRASASDGVSEIHQTCATLTGCFSGDAAGFPVTIDGGAGSSYLLTSDLDVANVATNGIYITAAGITVDLNGFGLRGPTICSGTPTTCAPTGVGSGVRVESHAGTSVESNSVVENCVATQTGDDGVKAIGADVVSGCATESNHSLGIFAGPGSTVIGNSARKNDSIGIVAGDGTAGAKGVLIAHNSSRENTLGGILISSGGIAQGNTVNLNGDDGIDGGDGALILDNSVVSNGNGVADDGIECDAGCAVRGNVLRSNSGFGLSLGVGSAYSGNTVTANGTGTVAGRVAWSENYCDGAAAPN